MKRVLLVLALTLPLGAQQTIYQQLFNAANPANGATSIVVNNAGQAQHMVNYQVTSQPTKTCVTPTALRLEGSFNNTNFVGISPISYTTAGASVTVPYTNSVFGYGGYPYVRVKIVVHDTNNCLVSVWYTGTLFPANINDVSYTWLGFLSLTNTATGTGDLPVVATPSGGASSNPGKPTLYGATFILPLGAILTLQCKDSTGSVLRRNLLQVPARAAEATIVLPASKQPYYQCQDNESVYLNIAGTFTGTVSVSTVYRFE